MRLHKKSPGTRSLFDYGLSPFIHFLRMAMVFVLTCITVCVSSEDSAQKQRISEHPAVFADLAPAAQKQVRARNIERGQTLEMIYLVLGTPDYVETSADGTETQWIYKKFYHQVKITGVELFPSRPKRDSNTKLRADRMDHLLLGASSQTREEYARANTHGGFEMAKPPRELPAGDDPLLPGAELEIIFHARLVSEIKVTRDSPFTPAQPVGKP
jgi:hypothetical protein